MKFSYEIESHIYSFAQGYREVKKAPPGLTYQLDESYFLTDPETFVYNHYPNLDEWQLLARPVTASEFKVGFTQRIARRRDNVSSEDLNSNTLFSSNAAYWGFIVVMAIND